MPKLSSVLGVALAAALAVTATACGSSKSNAETTTTTANANATATAAWAGGVCTAVATWESQLQSLKASAKSNPSKGTLQEALGGAKTATQTLVDAVKSLGAPNGSDGSEAKSTLNDLSTQLQADVATIQKAIDSISGISGSAAAVSTISSTVVTMRGQIETAAKKLKSLPTGDLQQAFKTAPSCVSLKNASTASS